jgi:hypothetical protein
MNFYVLAGTSTNHSVFSLVLDNDAQNALSSMFQPLVDSIRTGEHVSFDPGYRPDEGEIVTVSPYSLPKTLSALQESTDAAALKSLNAEDIDTARIRGIAAVDWNGTQSRLIAFQRIESRYVLKREPWRLMLAKGRFVIDDRPGLEIAERVDAVVEGETLYVASWPRAHSVLDLSFWAREATVAEMEAFFGHKKLALADGFDPKALADSVVRRKITSIGMSKVLERCSPQNLRRYASKFGVPLQVSNGRIVLPSEKKEFKAVLGLLDEDLLSFEPTDERWVVNSKRRVT